MKIRITHTHARPGLVRHKDEVHDLPDAEAAAVIASGHAVPHDDSAPAPQAQTSAPATVA